MTARGRCKMTHRTCRAPRPRYGGWCVRSGRTARYSRDSHRRGWWSVSAPPRRRSGHHGRSRHCTNRRSWPALFASPSSPERANKVHSGGNGPCRSPLLRQVAAGRLTLGDRRFDIPGHGRVSRDAVWPAPTRAPSLRQPSLRQPRLRQPGSRDACLIRSGAHPGRAPLRHAAAEAVAEPA